MAAAPPGPAPQDAPVLITGASDGIGLALARHLDAQGAALVLTGRRARLDDPLAERHPYVPADLAAPAEAAQTLRAALAERSVTALRALVLNAAVGSFAPVAREARERVLLQLAVNLEAPLALVHALLPLVLRTRGTVALVSSVAAYAPCPDYAVYGATKTALDGFARALRVELEGRARVLLLHPGATRTGIHVRAGAPADEVARLARRWPAPEAVAAAFARALDGRGTERTVGWGNRVARLVCRRLPGLVERTRPCTLGSGAAPAPDAPGPRRALVTGAADGIGRALAERLRDAGTEVLGVDCDAARASTVPGVRFLLGDLGDPADLARLEEALAREGPFHLVVHNAGINRVGRFEHSDLAEQRRVLDVNLRAPLLLTRRLLAEGRVARGGSLVLVSSLSHAVGYPGAAAYAASKDGLAAYARSLGPALRQDGIHVLRVLPGPVRTAHARRHAPPGADESRRMPPERVAEAILAGVARRRRVLVPGLANRVAAVLGAWLPGRMDRLMRRLILDRLPPAPPR